MVRSAARWLLALGLGLAAVVGPLFSGDDKSSEPGIFDQVAIVRDGESQVQEGVQPLAKGVVHEAFATPTVFAAEPGATVNQEPPPAIEEMPPEHKPEGDNVQWINGYFAYDDQARNFYWVSGIWRNV